ncbi:MAG: hypothetical protein AMXMBFR13_04900 [Phycisphaerae bacterium]
MRGILFVVALFSLALSWPVDGAIYTSAYGGGQQVWITSDSFTARSEDGGVLNYIVDPDANALSGSAYYFHRDDSVSAADEQLNWWAEYRIPEASLPAGFVAGQTWYFKGRVQQPLGEASPYWYGDADFLLVNGHPSDLSVSNPSENDWINVFDSGNVTNEDDRIFNDLHLPDPKPVRPNWLWIAENPTAMRPKTLSPIDGEIIFRLYEREAGPENARVDVMVFASSPNYVPTDADFVAAVPEPATALLLAGVLCLGLPIRRRVRRF